MTPRHFYGCWPEVEYVEVGQRVAIAYDEPTSIEHRLARANRLTYGCPPRHWQWSRPAEGDDDGA